MATTIPAPLASPSLPGNSATEHLVHGEFPMTVQLPHPLYPPRNGARAGDGQPPVTGGLTSSPTNSPLLSPAQPESQNTGANSSVEDGAGRQQPPLNTGADVSPAIDLAGRDQLDANGSLASGTRDQQPPPTDGLRRTGRVSNPPLRYRH